MSSDSPSAVVSRLYSCFGAGDMPGILSTLSEDVDWIFYGPSAVPFAGHYRGHDEMLRFFGTVAQTVAPERFEPHEFIEAGENVVVLGSETVLVKETGRRFNTDWVHVITVRDGKIVRLREVYDTAPIVDAFAPTGTPAGTVAEK